MVKRRRKKALTLFERWGMDVDMPQFVWRKKPDGTYGEEEEINLNDEKKKAASKSRKDVK